MHECVQCDTPVLTNGQDWLVLTEHSGAMAEVPLLVLVYLQGGATSTNVAINKHPLREPWKQPHSANQLQTTSCPYMITLGLGLFRDSVRNTEEIWNIKQIYDYVNVWWKSLYHMDGYPVQNTNPPTSYAGCL